MKHAQFCLLLMISLFFGLIHAAYLTDMPITISQPDGSKIACFVSGDEYHNWLHDADKYTIIQDPDTGYYTYANLINGRVQATDLIVGKDIPLGIRPAVNISEEEYKAARAVKYPMPESRDAPTSGTINNLVIFIRFAGESEFGQSISTYDGWFNSNSSSLKNYFLEASYNQLTVNTSFYPLPNGTSVLSWQDSHSRSYFQPYSSSNTNGYNGDTERRDREFTLLQNACAAMDAVIPNSLNIDSDNDGRVDNVVFIISGGADGWNELLWPHRWAIYDRYVYINNKRVYDFNFQLRDFLTSQNVGVLCHEFFHTLGAPDLYHYTSNGISPVGSWDLMQSNTNPPQHMGAYMKYKYGDWIDSIPTLSTDQAYTLNPLTMSSGQAYRINSTDSNQYYVLEYRRKTGTFESSLPGSGLLIYRIDTRENGNADGPPDEVYLFRPGGSPTANGSINNANFSLETGRSVFNSSSDPYPFLQNGSLGNLSIFDIGSANGATISFTKGSIPVVEWDFSEAPYPESFEASFPPQGWLSQIGSGTKSFERVTSGGSPTCSPYNGSAMLRYNSYSASSNSSTMLITPILQAPDTVDLDYQVSFAMYRDSGYSTNADRIELYLNSNPNLSGSPVLIGTVHRSRSLSPTVSSNGWYQYSYALPLAANSTKYLIFNAVSGYGNNIFIDDFQLFTSLKLPYSENFDSVSTPTLPGSLSVILNSSSSSAYVRSSTSQKFSEPNSVQMTNSSDLNADLRLVSAALPLPLNRLRLRLQARASSAGQVLQIGTQSSATSEFNLLYSKALIAVWEPLDLNLAPYSGTERYLVFKHGLGATYRSIYLDDIEILPLPANDMELNGLSGPAYSLSGMNMEFQVSVLNSSYNPLNSYSVQLRDAQTNALLSQNIFNHSLSAGESAMHSMICNIPYPGSYEIVAVVQSSGDSVAGNNISAPHTLRILAPNAEAHAIADPDAALSANTMPFNFYWKNSVVETIYSAEEIFYPNGNIVGIMYHYNFVQDIASQALKLWMKNTVAQNLSSGWMDAAGYTLVFDGTVDFSQGTGAVYLNFPQAFSYAGGNLAIRSNRPMDSAYYNSSNHFLQYTDALRPSRSRYQQSDTTAYNPLAPSAAGTLSSNLPQITLLMENITLEPVLLQVLPGAETIQLSWNPTAGARSYQVWHSNDLSSWQLLSNQQSNSFEAGVSLKAFFKVVASSLALAEERKRTPDIP